MKHFLKNKVGAFTLIELLVVIAIIGILASLLLPVFGRAKKKARSLASVNNQSQIAKAYVMYLDDNEGWYPVVAGPASVGCNQGFAWCAGLKPCPMWSRACTGPKCQFRNAH